MNKLISESTRVEISKRIIDVLRYYNIDSWQSKPYFQHQNFAKRRWQDVKRLTLHVLHTSSAPDYTWLLALKYVANIMNMTAVQSLNWKTPLESLTNQVPDTSIALLFQFYDKVYFKAPKGSFPSDTIKKKGYFVGFAHDVGHAMTFKVLNATTLKIINQSIIPRASEQRNLHIDLVFSPTQTPTPFLSPTPVLSLPHLPLCSAHPVIRICSRGDCCC
jgi:hypothetical protein